ncbi:MAG: efflux RND transporter periplasmic adaptor subunit, partial [Deltaproteobacteria bacterium]|nr:efflux RND transporter periplasmic adaptor subunit [Deltaproteobacteria bacterium]
VMGQSPKRPASPVVVEKVVRKHVRPMVTLIGTAEPHRRSVVAPQVEGLVIDFPVGKGQKIAKGDILVRIERVPLLLQLKAARANLGEAKENHKNALSELKRTTALYKRKSVSNKAYDGALYKANALKKKIMALEARIETIQYDIEKCMIRAPFAGFVVEEHTQLGQWLKEGGEVVTIVEIDPILVSIPVPDRYIHSLKVGQEVDLTFDFLPGDKTRKGAVRDIIPAGNEKARTFPVLIRVANHDLTILAGMSCKVSFPVGKPEKKLLVDKDAVVTGGRGHQVFVVRHGKAVPVQVKKGPAYGSLVVVEGDLSAGDMVVIEGNERLRPGQEVQVKTGRRG